VLADLLPIALLGAVLGLDVVSFPQAMISRPLVAATAAAALLGHPVHGLVIGAALELIALETLPFGASRYPEWGSAAVVGGALYASSVPSAGALTVAVLGALAAARVSSTSMVLLRRLNARWARAHLAEVERGSARTVEGLQVWGLTADLVRGGVLTAAAYALLRPLAAVILARWGASAASSRAIVVGVAATVAAAAAWKIFHATAGARWYFLGGLAAGLVLLALR
jgi:mannose/fructose/N-acetylgalactosamine-specific phosphotransferase system component IIC